MFFARSRNTPSTQALVGGVSSATPLETAFKPTRTMTERVNVVSELVNIKVSSPVDTDFSIQVRLTGLFLDRTVMFRTFKVTVLLNPLRPNSDLSQTSHCNIKGLSVSEVMRIDNMITQVKFY